MSVLRSLIIIFVFCVLATTTWFVLIGKGTKINSQPALVGSMKKFIPVKKRPDPVSLTFFKDNNTTVALSEWRGKVVLLNFWATWCSPCIREMPSIQKLSKLLSKESFAVLALSQDIQGWSKIGPFIQKYQLNDLPIYNDPKLSGAKKFAVKGLPTTILLDRDGRELGRLLGHAEWDSKEAIDLIKYHLSNY